MRVVVFVPTGPLTVKATVYVPALVEVWERLVLEVFVLEPSPKFQKRFVIVPAELSVKSTVNGFNPLVGLAWKPATGTIAPVPVRELVMFPALVVFTMS